MTFSLNGYDFLLNFEIDWIMDLKFRMYLHTLFAYQIKNAQQRNVKATTVE